VAGYEFAEAPWECFFDFFTAVEKAGTLRKVLRVDLHLEEHRSWLFTRFAAFQSHRLLLAGNWGIFPQRLVSLNISVEGMANSSIDVAKALMAKCQYRTFLASLST
jgi:hypothetical protein